MDEWQQTIDLVSSGRFEIIRTQSYYLVLGVSTTGDSYLRNNTVDSPNRIRLTIDPVDPPPTASAVITNITTPGGTFRDFTVTYRDNVAVDASTIGADDIVVVGPIGIDVLPVTFLRRSTNTDGSPISATYRINAPGGTWDAADNGLYRVGMNSAAVSDTSGNFVPIIGLETFSVSIPVTPPPPPVDTIRPTAIGNASKIKLSAGNAHSISVQYMDNVAVDVSDIGANDIRITGPNSFSQTATFFSKTHPNILDSPLVGATYRISSPGTRWMASDNGTYTIVMFGGAVSDTNGNLIRSGTIGTFEIAIPEDTSIFSVTDVSVVELDSGSKNAIFFVTRTNGSASNSSVQYLTQDGSATADTDYLSQSGTLEFSAGETTKLVRVPVIGDLQVETDETFSLLLSNPVNGTISDGIGIGTILNDDDDGNDGPNQRITSDATTRIGISNGILEVPVLYSTVDSSGNPVALSANILDVNLHFDSTRLQFLGFVDGSEFVEHRVAASTFSESSVSGDDGDADTDTVLRTSFSDGDALQNPGWPNAASATPLSLYVARFQVADFVGTTTIRFTANQSANVVGQASAFGFESQNLTVNVVQATGDGDGDGDFDGNDTFLINIEFLGATDAQLGLFKGNSPLTTESIRSNIEQLRAAGILDVDGDGDTDANDSFLTNIVMLGATDAQLSAFIGESPLTPAQIRQRIDDLFPTVATRFAAVRQPLANHSETLAAAEINNVSGIDEVQSSTNHVPAYDLVFVAEQFDELAEELF